MDRRDFVKLCACSAAMALASRDCLALASIEAMPPTILTDKNGRPLKAAAIPAGDALVFTYPLAGVPCFLINLGDKVARPGLKLKNQYGEYEWTGGVGANNHIVAFVAICVHQMIHPLPEASYLRYDAYGSQLSRTPGRIICCAHASVFDPVDGGKPLSGPATFPLLPVRLVYDAASDELVADGIMGMELIQRFFKYYEFELIAHHGPDGYLLPVGAKTAAIPLSEYSAFVPTC